MSWRGGGREGGLCLSAWSAAAAGGGVVRERRACVSASQKEEEEGRYCSTARATRRRDRF
jgi:hypothetical protein